MIILDTAKLTEIFVLTDDFIIEYEDKINQRLLGGPPWKGKMSKSEIMTILIFFHLSGIRCFKWYYSIIIKKYLSSYFPCCYSYENFVSMQPEVNFELFIFLHLHRLEGVTEANYIDSKPLKVCHIKREKQHKVFKNIAAKGKTSTGWFFGLKLHLICNQQGGIVSLWLSPGNKADNDKQLLRQFLEGFKGKLYGDKGYITSLREELEEKGCRLITKIKKNMKPLKLEADEKHFLKYRGIIETVFDLMVNQCQIEHSRHRSVKNFISNLWAGLIAYTFLKNPEIPNFQQKFANNEFVLLKD